MSLPARALTGLLLKDGLARSSICAVSVIKGSTMPRCTSLVRPELPLSLISGHCVTLLPSLLL